MKQVKLPHVSLEGVVDGFYQTQSGHYLMVNSAAHDGQITDCHIQNSPTVSEAPLH